MTTDDYLEGKVVSFSTHINPDPAYPWWFRARPAYLLTSGNAYNILEWGSQAPYPATNAYEVYRGLSGNFTSRGSDTRLYNIGPAASVALYDDGGAARLLPAPIAGSGYWYVLRKYHGISTITNCTGVSGTYILTTTNNFNTGFQASKYG